MTRFTAMTRTATGTLAVTVLARDLQHALVRLASMDYETLWIAGPNGEYLAIEPEEQS